MDGWPEAVECCSDGEWENIELEAQNQLTEWLHQHDRERYQKWNSIVTEHKADVVDRLTEETWIPYQQSHGLSIAIVHATQWGALMENSYLGFLLADLARTKLGETPRPRQSKPRGAHSRHIPAAGRRAVWKRDGGRCAFVGTRGRCCETGLLEFHHVVPFAVGGSAEMDKIELRCAAHNRHEAALYFVPGQPWRAGRTDAACLLRV